MKKRTFVKASSMLLAGTTLSSIIHSCDSPKKNQASKTDVSTPSSGLFTLLDLTYDFNSLEPSIDAKTMEIHHDRHHAGYVRKFNVALEGSPLKGKDLTDIMAELLPDDTNVRNNGGGHFNHSLFWSVMSPNGGGLPSGDLADAINSSFDSFDHFKNLFSEAAKTRFGSGWAWLSQGSDGKLFVSSTSNQDNPLMVHVVAELGTPLLGIDVWEHAYYLSYQNKRGDYINNFFNIVDWDAVASPLR